MEIRNFCIIAHVDHGKTTLSDRLLEKTKTIEQRNMKEQILDSMDLERERGITIKCHPVSMFYQEGGREYLLNLIDTPGHVDFAYEVSRSLAACEGAVLLIDASQGIEAQTVENTHLALKQGLTIIPVINKIDLPSAHPEIICRQLEEILAIPAEEAILASGKTGKGIGEVLSAVIQRVPAPEDNKEEKTRALIFDSLYDAYKGVICYVRVFSGKISVGDRVQLMHSTRDTIVKEVGMFSPKMKPCQTLATGQVGYLITQIKSVSEVKIGDTITQAGDPAKEQLPGYQEIQSMVFSGIYPLDTSDYEKLKTSLAKLQLNDASLKFQPESCLALGFGFRCGFLGLLHMEIIQERLRREYELDVLSTYPSVVYKLQLTNGETIWLENPSLFPDVSSIEAFYEPMIEATLHVPTDSLGNILALITEKRGVCTSTETLDRTRMIFHARLPLNEILIDFNDSLKSLTRGYGSMDYRLGEYELSDLVKLDILVNGEVIDAFSTIIHRSKADSRGRNLCEKLKELLPPSLFKIAIQAAVGSKIIARETISALRKDVTAKCYGGDITRKRKLLEKQKEGKKRMKQIGHVSIPQETFIKILKT